MKDILIILLIIIIVILNHNLKYKNMTAKEWSASYQSQIISNEENQKSLNYLFMSYEKLQVCIKKSSNINDIGNCLKDSPRFTPVGNKES